MIPLKGWGVKASSWRLNLLVDSNWRAFERGFGSTWIIVNNGGNGHVMAMSYWPTVRVGTLLSLLVILYNLAACWNAAPGTCAYYILNLTKCHTISDFFPPNQRIVIASSVCRKSGWWDLSFFMRSHKWWLNNSCPCPASFDRACGDVRSAHTSYRTMEHGMPVPRMLGRLRNFQERTENKQIELNINYTHPNGYM